MNLVEKASIKLMIEGKIFYSTLLCKIKKIPDSSIMTLGVTTSNGEIIMYYNPNFLDTEYKLTGLDGLSALIEHELLHLVYEHLFRAKAFARHERLYNVAADIAINQYIPHLDKKRFLFPESFKLPPKKDAEFYYEQLINNLKTDCSDNSIQQKMVDNHSRWKNSDALSKEVVKQVVAEAYKAHQKYQGFLSRDIERSVEKLLQPSKIDWKALLRQYVEKSIKVGKIRSFKRPNRRLNIDWLKGKVAYRTVRILVAIDTSGSINKKEFIEFMSEIKGLMSIYKTKIEVVECDTKIQRKYTLYPYKSIDTNFKGGGGTSYKPVFDYVIKKGVFDLLIYFTDLYCDFKGCKNIIPVIWVVSTGYNSNNKVPFGEIVNIKAE